MIGQKFREFFSAITVITCFFFRAEWYLQFDNKIAICLYRAKVFFNVFHNTELSF